MDLARVEAERRRLADRTGAEGADAVAERIVAEVLAGQRDVDEVLIPDDPSALFDDDGALSDDASPAAWARRIVADVLDRSPAEPTAAPVADRPVDRRDVGPDEHQPDRARRRERELDLVPERRAYWASLAGDEPLALLPGAVVAPDGAAWAPQPDTRLERAVDRVLGSLEVTESAEDQRDGFEPVLATSAPALGWRTGRTVAWTLFALVWAAAAASLVPFAFEGGEAAIDFTFDIWGQ